MTDKSLQTKVVVGNHKENSQPIQINQRRSDEALRQILELIFDGRLLPGSRLPPERELSEIVGVSRTTLRDALNRLEVRGYIERRSKSGNYVCTAIPQTLRAPIEEIIDTDIVGLKDIIDIRKALEVWAVKRAAQAPRPDAIKGLKECLKTMKANIALRNDEQFNRYSSADARLHEIISEMTGNPVYVHLFHYFTNLLGRMITITRQLTPDNFAEHNLTVHERIYEAIKAEDPALAEKAMNEHFQFVENLVSRRVRKAVPRVKHQQAFIS